MTDWQRLEKVIEYTGLTTNAFAKSIGYKRAENLYRIERGENGISKKLASDITIKYCNISESFLLTGEGSMLKSESSMPESNAYYSTEKNTFTVPLVSQYAYAGYLAGFADPEYMEKQPTYAVKYDHNGGNYIAFEVRGDSMDDDSRRGICGGDIVLGCELKKDYWVDNLFIPKVFIIVHRESGIIIKEIISKDNETGMITCHSWNPSPEYRDFTIHFKDIQQMFYIKEINRNFKL